MGWDLNCDPLASWWCFIQMVLAELSVIASILSHIGFYAVLIFVMFYVIWWLSKNICSDMIDFYSKQYKRWRDPEHEK